MSVTAPGVNVTGAYPGIFPQAYNPGDNGTSFATAFASGVAALVRAAYPGLGEAQVVTRITATADGPAGPGTGRGMVNPVQAVTAVLPAAALATGAGALATAGAAGPEGRVPITRASAPDQAARTVAVSVATGAAGLAVLVVAAALVLPAGRRRHWRPGLPPQ